MRSIIPFVLALLLILPSFCLSGKKEDIKENKSQTANIIIGKFDLPVGGIIAWVPPNGVEFRNNYKYKTLPHGFLLCDGALSKDDEKTEFDERLIPKLNDESKSRETGYVWIIKVKK